MFLLRLPVKRADLYKENLILNLGNSVDMRIYVEEFGLKWIHCTIHGKLFFFPFSRYYRHAYGLGEHYHSVEEKTEDKDDDFS